MFSVVMNLIYQFFSVFIGINSRKVLLIPKSTSVSYNKSISSDNVLCILNDILDQPRSLQFTFYYISYDQYPSRIQGKFASARAIPTFRGWLGKFMRKAHIFYTLMSSKYIFSSSPVEPLPFKRASQIHIVANYYNPFKSDLYSYDIKHPTANYVFTPSLMSAHIDSSTSSIPVKNYIVTGFPRNDYLISPKFSRSDLLQKLELDINIQTLIVFAPTHRNSSQSDIKLDAVNFLSLIQAILPILQDNNAAIVLANHPASGNDLNEVSDFCNAHGLICLLSVYESISIYDVMAHTDLLISDYSSIYFDFLLLARPVIFYFSDFSKYQDVRSFSYDPVDSICAGPVCYDNDQLLHSLKRFFDNPLLFKDQYAQKLLWVRELSNKYCDAFSSSRIISFLLTNVLS